MEKYHNSFYPKVSIITCVFNGEKYISKLFDSVLNMNYPSIEHIIVDDGSTDNTSKIVHKYEQLYREKRNANLYINYIKQNNMGLGFATNVGLKAITGLFWTWINCDDWYLDDAFFEPVEFLMKNPKKDYIQMNGYFFYSDNRNEQIIQKRSDMAFTNKSKLIVQYRDSSTFRWLLYLCRTDSFAKINKDLTIYPSKYTQDDQLITQMFGLLNGDFCMTPKWCFLQRGDSLLKSVNVNLKLEENRLREESINMLSVSKFTKKSFLAFYREKHIVEKIKLSATNSHIISVVGLTIKLIVLRFQIKPRLLLYLDHKIVLYLIYSIIPRFLKKHFF